MCMFTLDVRDVADTCIFTRLRGGRQLLVYQMTYAADQPLAMVLPLPVTPGAAEDDLRFIDLTGCERFFRDLRQGFPRPYGERHEKLSAGANLEFTLQRKLEVREVGAYEASFVPGPEDFARLDERFRLPLALWLQLRHYGDWGFAVFRLRATGKAQVHPMAFEFPTRHPDRLFFPTLHIHHRSIEAEASFDHELYCQPSPAMHWHLHDWEESTGPVKRFFDCEGARAWVDPDFPCWRAVLKGRRANQDAWLGAGVGLPEAAP